MQIQKPKTLSFAKAMETGEIVEKSGYHQPGNIPIHSTHRGCGCEKTTDKGAYRDTTIELPDGTLLHYYHQNLVVAENSGIFWVSNQGYQTSTTKERINRYLPRGYFVRQKDFVWYLETVNGNEVEFQNGMLLEESGEFVLAD